MRKTVLCALTVLLSLSAAAQAQLQTKQYIVSDFREKTMKVLLTGNEMTDASLRENIQSVWNISPYEFCTEEEFNATKSSPDFYFLTIADSRRSREAEAGLKIIGIYKGAAGAKDLNSLYKVVTIPYCPAEDADGREMVFLPALLNILQNQVNAIMERSINVSNGIVVDLKTKTNKWGNRCAIAMDDFSVRPDDEALLDYGAKNIDVVDYDTVEEYLSTRTEGVMVGYVVAPSTVQKGSVCYTMIIDAASWDIYYFKKRRISSESPAGFTAKDAATIMLHSENK